MLMIFQQNFVFLSETAKIESSILVITKCAEILKTNVLKFEKNRTEQFFSAYLPIRYEEPAASDISARSRPRLKMLGKINVYKLQWLPVSSVSLCNNLAMIPANLELERCRSAQIL